MRRQKQMVEKEENVKKEDANLNEEQVKPSKIKKKKREELIFCCEGGKICIQQLLEAMMTFMVKLFRII